MFCGFRYCGVVCFGVLTAACETSYTPLRSVHSNVTFASTEVVGPKRERLMLDGYLSAPAGAGRYPAVVLLHTCGGLTNHLVREWPEFLNRLGYLTLSVDSYSPRGARRCTDLDRDFRRMAAAKDAYSALAFLSGRADIDSNRVAVIGFSAGANAINFYLLTNVVRPIGNIKFRAAVGFYGRCHQLYNYSKADIPAMQIVGELDVQHAPDCAAVGKSTPMEVHILPGAEHSFDNGERRGIRYDPYGNRMEFNRSARDTSRELTKAFLAKHLAP